MRPMQLLLNPLYIFCNFFSLSTNLEESVENMKECKCIWIELIVPYLMMILAMKLLVAAVPAAALDECGHSYWVIPVPPKLNVFQNYRQKNQNQAFLKQNQRRVSESIFIM